MKPAASFCLTAASNRATVSSTEYLLGLVIRPSSAACAAAGPAQIASESAKLAATRFLKLIRIPNVLCFAGSDATGRTRCQGAAYHRQDDAASQGCKSWASSDGYVGVDD